MHDLLLDVRHAVRGFRKTPAFTLVAAISLALAIGASGFVFAVLDAVVLRPLEVRDPQTLYQVRYGPRMSGSNLTTSYPALQDLRRRNTSFSDMIGVWAYSEARLGGRDAVGIRMALGARQAHVVLVAVGRPAALLGVGSALGLLAAVLASRLLGRIVYQADPGHPAVLIGAVSTMALIGIAGAAIPALRALAVDPSRLMRDE